MPSRVKFIKKGFILLYFCFLFRQQINAQSTDFQLPAPIGGQTITLKVLTNGNYVIADPYFNDGAIPQVGVVFLYDGLTNTLISTLKGTTAYDLIGLSVTALSNGNYVVSSPYWDNGNIINAGAFTWCNGTTGLNGVVNSNNSLVGSSKDDLGASIYPLSNGNYILRCNSWDNGAITNAGAVTWCNGATGITGVVSSNNSLVGSHIDDYIGSDIVILKNSNYIIISPNWKWDGGYGAVTWGSGTEGVKGEIGSNNSLLGRSEGSIGSEIFVLNNDNYVVLSNHWKSDSVNEAGAVTWGSGTNGVSGYIDVNNSLVGIGEGNPNIIPLTNGNYVVMSPQWRKLKDGIENVGAVTFCDGFTGTSGVINSNNSLVGADFASELGNSVIALSNGNYVVNTPLWDLDTIKLVFNGTKYDTIRVRIENVGAVTWGSGTEGIHGVISKYNSLVGTQANDLVGLGIIPLRSGDYVTISSLWNNETIPNAGAVTLCPGNASVTGEVNKFNSVVGSTAYDHVGNGGVAELTNGNFVVSSYSWDNSTTGTVDAGAVTLYNGLKPFKGEVIELYSLVGDKTNGNVGSYVTPLTDGNFVVSSPAWDNFAGAVTWCDGFSFLGATVNNLNSLVGSAANDRVGYKIVPLSNGNYIVASPFWDNGALNDAGAVSFGGYGFDLTGAISKNNSLVANEAGAWLGYNGLRTLSNGNYVVEYPDWDNGTITNAGAVTWGNGLTGTSGDISSSNSLVGSSIGERVGISVVALTNGDYIVKTAGWDNGAISDGGAVSFVSGINGLTGTINSCNSVLGTTIGSGSKTVSEFNYIYNYLLVVRPLDNIMTRYDQADATLASAKANNSVNIAGNGDLPLLSNDCKLIATIETGVSNGTLSGTVNSKLWIDGTQSAKYAKRHYEITPASNASTATARITLYATQSEFNDYNNQIPSPTLLMPTNSNDNLGIANLRIEKRGGTGDENGSPDSYQGPKQIIDPADKDIVWNNIQNRWEISFEVTGFSGFFITTGSIVLATNWLSFTGNLNGEKHAILNWKVQEQAVARYEIEKSINSFQFSKIGVLNSKGEGVNSYSFMESMVLSGEGYYKIKQIDKNGNYTYSRIVKLFANENPLLSIFPNPANDKVTLLVDKALLNKKIVLTDLCGKPLQVLTINELSLNIKIGNYANGVYILNFEDGTRRKILKQ